MVISTVDFIVQEGLDTWLVEFHKEMMQFGRENMTWCTEVFPEEHTPTLLASILIGRCEGWSGFAFLGRIPDIRFVCRISGKKPERR